MPPVHVSDPTTAEPGSIPAGKEQDSIVAAEMQSAHVSAPSTAESKAVPAGNQQDNNAPAEIQSAAEVARPVGGCYRRTILYHYWITLFI